MNLMHFCAIAAIPHRIAHSGSWPFILLLLTCASIDVYREAIETYVVQPAYLSSAQGDISIYCLL